MENNNNKPEFEEMNILEKFVLLSFILSSGTVLGIGLSLFIIGLLSDYL
jgi:hypothetical protein